MMTLSKLRQKYQPVLPKILSQIDSVSFEKSNDLPVQAEIKKLFPKISEQSVIIAKKGVAQKFPALKIGAVFSGGQAPGGHNVLTGLFDALQTLNVKAKLIGFLDGPCGVLAGKWTELNSSALLPYRNQGGFDLLGSGRTKIETDDQLRKTLQIAQDLDLDGLVVIGGDDSNTNAAFIAEYFLQHSCKTKVIGVPKTIDGDLQNPFVEISFGFDTATKIYAELIGNISKDALSAKKYYHFIKLMGRSASHITLECALKIHPNHTLISEERHTLAEITLRIADLVEQREELGKRYGVILIPEGLIEHMPEMSGLIKELKKSAEHLSPESQAVWEMVPDRVQQQLLLERDPHGNINLSAVETELVLIEAVTKELKKRKFKGKFAPLAHFFGYEGRAGLPTNFDANYCYTLGHTAALLIAHGCTGCMAFVHQLAKPPKEWSIGGVPLSSQLILQSQKKPVIVKTYVDLKGTPYGRLQKQTAKWALEDDYQCPGPTQFFGEPAVTDSIPLILQ
ncbi:MAG TPA: diphosphate--fructose-6-phosphate 1-phosphotransferase [Rhabdochlamydiaceae bacterium]|nr:diphosphate--fructose-6-phosphate 1-phosphotransferase [Rhabdochlamydiaceae bacterium]